MPTLTALTPIAIQFAPDAEVVTTTWGDFRASNRDAFTSDEFDALATDLNESFGAYDGTPNEPVPAGMALIWIAE